MQFVDIAKNNRDMVNLFLGEHWGSTDMVIRGEMIDMTRINGIVAYDNDIIAGLITYLIRGKECEITSLDSVTQGIGIGTELINQVIKLAQDNQCVKIKLITTNDNINAIRFYQKRGFDITHFYKNAIEKSRQLKPSIPMIGNFGIPLKHEIEFELLL